MEVSPAELRDATHPLDGRSEQVHFGGGLLAGEVLGEILDGSVRGLGGLLDRDHLIEALEGLGEPGAGAGKGLDAGVEVFDLGPGELGCATHALDREIERLHAVGRLAPVELLLEARHLVSEGAHVAVQLVEGGLELLPVKRKSIPYLSACYDTPPSKKARARSRAASSRLASQSSGGEAALRRLQGRHAGTRFVATSRPPRRIGMK